MLTRVSVVALLTVTAGLSADWNPRLAAQFLDSREKDWFAWKTAASADGPCVSCHTGLTYLLARPLLRHRLAETEPTVWETGLLDRLKSHAGEKRPGILQGVESTFTALFLAREDQKSSTLSGQLSVDTRRAFDQMWTLQTQNGDPDGGIKWYSAKLDPWETPEAFRWGSALAAMAVGSAPASYRSQPDVRSHVKALTDYLQADFEKQPLHHRLGILWASSQLPEALPEATRKSVIEDVLGRQQKDGGWSIESLGPWQEHSLVSPASGSSAYATGYTAYILQTAGYQPRTLR
jgi:hypothetical protein